MPRNVEIKARVDSIDALAASAAALATAPPVTLVQDDTFFRCGDGRLKLRVVVAGCGELIFYRRADRRGPKESFYVCAPTAEPDALRAVLALACGEAGRVRKHRTLFLAGRTRIHLDRVEGLGDFLELEVVLADGESAADGAREAHRLMAQLGINASQLIEGAYVDLLAASRA
jgi:adenylate cyclase class IV